MAQNVVEILIRAKDEASKVLKGVQGEASRSAAATRRDWQALSQASTVAVGAMVAVGGAAVTAGVQFVRLAGQLEQSKIAFETMLGSAEQADAFLKDLADFAAATPFDFPGLQDSSRLLLAFGFQADAVIPIVETLGDATSALGGGTDTLEGVVRALGQMQTKGKVVTQELLQLAERGIPVFDILKEKLDLTGEQVADIGSLGISSSTAITAILEGLGERFGGAMAKQSRTILGLWSTVKDNVSLIATDIGSQLIESLNLTGHLETVIGWLDTLRERVQTLDLKQLWVDGREGIIAFTGALVAMAVPALINVVRTVAPLVARLGALALAGALVADVARQLGVDFGALGSPSGALARVASVALGLVDVFRGVTTSITNLILASAKGFGDWAEFFRKAADAVGNVITQLGRQATAVTDLLGALATFDGGKITAAWDALRNVGGFSLGADLKTAWTTSFDGLEDTILDGFVEAGKYVDSGWQRIIAGVTGNVDAATQSLATNVSDAVTTGAKKITDWSKLLTGDASPALLDVAGAADSAGAAIASSAEAAAKAAITWQDALQRIGGAVATQLRDALGVDQPDSPLVQAGKAIVGSLVAGFDAAWPEAAARFAAGAQAIQDWLAWQNRPSFDSAAAFGRISDGRAARAAEFEESPGLSTLTKLPPSEAGVLWNAVAALVAAKAPVQKIQAAVDELTAAVPLSLAQVHALTGGMLQWSKSTDSYVQDAQRAAQSVEQAFNEFAPTWVPDGGLPPAWDLRRSAAEARGRGMGLPALPGSSTPTATPGWGAADIARDTLTALVETSAGLDQIKSAAEALTTITPLSVAELDKLTRGLYSQAVAAENAAARVDAAWASWAGVRAFDEDPGSAWQPEGGLPGVPTPVDLTGGAPTANVMPDRSHLPTEQLDALLRKEMEARQAVVDGLTQMSSEKGPLANFGAQLLGAAAEAVPAFGAALDGFVQAGPLGAVVAFFTELLASSAPMQQAFEALNAALKPLGDLLGHIIAPALRVLGTIVGWVVDALIAVYNALLGWLFGPFEKGMYDPPPPPEDELERQPRVHSGGPPSRQEMNFGQISPGVQMAVATPLVEAAQMHLTASMTMQTAANGMAVSAQAFGGWVQRLVEEGINVRLSSAATSTSPRETAYLR